MAGSHNAQVGIAYDFKNNRPGVAINDGGETRYSYPLYDNSASERTAVQNIDYAREVFGGSTSAPAYNSYAAQQELFSGVAPNNSAGCGNDYVQLYGEFSFSIGPQLGASLSVGVPLLAGFIQGPSVEIKIKPYLRYSKNGDWSVGVDVDRKNVNYKMGYSYPLNSYEKSSTHGIYEHPVFSKTTIEQQKGFLKITKCDGIEQTFFRVNVGATVRPLLFGVGADFGIEGPYNGPY